MAAFSTDLSSRIVVLAVVAAGVWGVLKVYGPLARIADSLDDIKTALTKRT